MAFNSLTFLGFLTVVYALFQLVSERLRGPLLLVASYFFYAYAHWPHLALLVGITVTTFYGSKVLQKHCNYFILGVFVSVVLIPLVVFKYINFKYGSFSNNDFSNIGMLAVLLPIGISFYTFQAISYLFDTYRGVKMPSVRLSQLSLYLAFFPQVLAGPIERGKNLLPQLQKLKRASSNCAYIGIKYMLWGFFCKLVIADNLSPTINQLLKNPQEQSGGTLSLVFILYSFQIYFDFLGYSNIAIGIARMFSVKLSTNFDRPYLSSSIKDFWRRWHITLSCWFRDYLYIPLGGNSSSGCRYIIVILTVFLVSGFWHGAGISFIAWGVYHGLSYIIEDKLRSMFRHSGSKARAFQRLITVMKIIMTFSLITLGWVLFRVNDLSQVEIIYSKILFLNNEVSYANISKMLFGTQMFLIYIFLVFALIIDSLRVDRNVLNKNPENIFGMIYEILIMNILIISLFLFHGGGNIEFIYRMF